VIPGQAAIETPSDRKVTPDPGPAAADDDRDHINVATDRRAETDRFLRALDSRSFSPLTGCAS
jgi:hypothetical protein